MDTELWLVELNKKVEIFLNENNIKTRRGVGHGIWLNVLLPIAVIISSLKYDCSPLYKISSCISCGLLVNALLTFIQINNDLFLRTLSGFISSSVTVLTLILFTKQGLIFNLIFGVLSSLGYQLALLAVLKLCPHSFTFGEASVVTQSGILFLSSTIANFGFETNTSRMQIATLILQIGLLGICFICTACFLFPKLRKPNEFYLTVTGVLLLFIILLLHLILGFSPVLWIINLLTADLFTVHLLIYWVVCSVIAIISVIIQVYGCKKASTVVRKIFHILAVAVFVPGLIFRPCLLYLASGICFALFVALELLRLLKMPPIGAGLQAGFLVFADEKDEGPLALTAIYLLLGCAGPLWLHPLPSSNVMADVTPPPQQFLPLLAGLLAVGVGDTAASACGTWFGQHYWPGYVPRSNLLKPTAAVAIASLVEARTEQIVPVYQLEENLSTGSRVIRPNTRQYTYEHTNIHLTKVEFLNLGELE
ncbi:dolichol kinase isoform X3 [Lycorma delicatula]|uniref:dolichol kinase isoform X3 n=1 Tax=Lycorma delicatula TaxID=130591 RepID=UPI003F510365